MPPAIEVHALSKSYNSNGKTVKAVNNLSLTIAPGQVFAFLGPNGAGKTTTIKMICGLIVPTSGQICLNGYDLARQPRKALGQIGAVLEGARNIYWRLSAWENLMYFGRLRGASSKKLKSYAEELLKELGLWDRRNDEVRVFSRGMQQKIAIASALITDPPIILLDEPTLGLDVQSAKVIEGWIEKLAHQRNKTVLITTHQLDMAQQVSDRVAIINWGELVANQSVDELLKLYQGPTYEMTVGGLIDESYLPLASECSITTTEDQETIIRAIPDQATLHGILDVVQRLDLPLISVNRVKPDLEQVFITLCDTTIPSRVSRV